METETIEEAKEIAKDWYDCDFIVDKIMKYLQDTFNCEFNHFTYNTFENMIGYAVNNFNNSENQLAYYLSDIIDELEFEEIKKVIDKE